MKLKDLPTEPMPLRFNRRIYAFFWAPFDSIFGLFHTFLGHAKVSLTLALAGWLLLMAAMWLFGSLEVNSGIGFLLFALLLGVGLAALFSILEALARLLKF